MIFKPAGIVSLSIEILGFGVDEYGIALSINILDKYFLVCVENQ